MFRFRSMQRHKEMRQNNTESCTETYESTNPSDSNHPPTVVPIVYIQCDPSIDADESGLEKDLYRVRSFKRTSKGLISLVRFRAFLTVT